MRGLAYMYFPRKSFFPEPLAVFPSQNDLLKQNHSYADDQKNIKGKKPPCKERHTNRSVQENPAEIQHKAAFLCAACTGKRRIACTHI